MSDSNFFGYTPNLPANAFGAAGFGVIAIIQLVLGIYTKEKWAAITGVVSAVEEMVAYIGRSILSQNDTIIPLWSMQLVLTVIGPVYMAAGLYYQLAVEVKIFGEQYSPIKPFLYNAIFTVCDVVAFVVQAAGGGYIAANIGYPPNQAKGEDIVLAGMAFQLFMMTIFIVLAIRVNYKIFTDDPANWNPEYAAKRERPLFKFWPYSIAISMAFLYIRTVYRIIEVADGWDGPIYRHEIWFLVFDGLMILLGMIPLCLVHSGLAHGRVFIRKHGSKNATTEDGSISDSGVAAKAGTAQRDPNYTKYGRKKSNLPGFLLPFLADKGGELYDYYKNRKAVTYEEAYEHRLKKDDGISDEENLISNSE